MKEYDETEAVKAMRAAVSDADATRYTDDDLLNLVDIIWDFYEVNGLLNIDIDEDEPEISIEDIADYARRMLRKDKGANIRPEDIVPLIEAEISYEDSILE